ncbi:MAG: hypothetical protein ACYCT0_10065 [Sulfobacillus sp.]
MEQPERESREPIRPPGWAEDELQEAYRNWIQQQAFFDEATDPAVVDQAILLWHEAEVRYRQCLKRRRQHGGF